jgi:signal transduction histidine kinase
MSSSNPTNKIKTATAVTVTVGLILYAVSVVAQSETSAAFKHFTTRNGMLSNSVYSFKPDKNRLYWVASGVGLQRFDGYSFDNWNQPENPKDERLFGAHQVFDDSKGNVWVFNMVRHFVFPAHSNKYIQVNTDFVSDNEFSNFALPVFEKNGRVWCFHSNSGFSGYNINTLKADKFIPLKFKGEVNENSISYPFISIDEIGAAWIVQDFEDSSYIVRFKPDEEIFKLSLPVKKFGRLKGFIPIGNNRFLFLSTAYSAIYSGLGFSQPEKILSTENIPGNFIRGLPFEILKINNKGSIIFPGENGIYEFNPSTVKLQLYISSEEAKTNLSRQLMFVLHEDQWGNIWIGRDASDGLLMFSPEKLKFDSHPAPSGYFNLVYSLAVGNDGRLFAANFQKGINVFDKQGIWEKYIELPKSEHDLNPSIRTMNFAGEKYLVMKSLFCKLFVLNTDNDLVSDISNLVPQNVMLQKNVFDAVFFKTGENELQFTHGDYILNFESNTGKFKVAVIDSLKNGSKITALTYTNNNTLCIGTENGCYLKEDKNWVFIDGTENYCIKYLTTDKNGILWAATTHGILCLDGNKIIKVYNVENGLLNEMIYGILFDDEENAWYSSNRGLGCIQKNGMLRFYSVADGLQGDEFDTQSFWKGNNGRMYFGGTNGINSFYPNQVLKDEYPGKIVLSGLQVNGNNYPLSGRVEEVSELQLEYNQNSLSLTFTLTNFSDALYNVYQVKMDGFDESWVNLGTTHSTRYHLMPGDYIFRVKGSSDGSNWSEEFLLPVKIKQAWWQNEWIKWGLGLAGILIIGFGIWLWNRRKANKLRMELNMQLEMQKERDRISRDLHDNIGAYSTALIANADDIEIAADGAETKQKVELLKENARNIMVSIRETIWLLNSKNLSITGFTEGFMNYCTNILRNFEGIEIEFNEEILSNYELLPAEAINLLRILQEIIQNIVKHANATKINCSVKSENELTFVISDNGKGFDLAEKIKGNGFKNMKYRALEIQFQFKINSKPGEGTEITLSGKPKSNTLK